ncbi:non-specific lipid transfer protein GPI-anchored 31-like isoform X2 [Rutidosis leptorrhynchoides]|uniref:non-specific lipid transfer protein GPI-anchored 31-like isoform X2 n=1 Tax=Rutidosis leptorrhynchoides TaxID=125765 RepID=UPI003A996BDC
MATTTTILFLCITAVVINVCVVDSAHHHTAAPAPAADCSTVILSMADCLSYVTAGSTVQKPEGTCCSGLKTVLKTDAQCLCEAFKNSAQLGLQLNTTKALALPAACKIKAPSATNCGIQSPMASGMAPTMAAFGPSIAVAPTPASQGSGSSGLAMSTISVFLSLLLSVYFCSY